MGKDRIAIIGATGDQGYGLALRFAKAGEDIIIGSRDQNRALDAAKRVRAILGGGVKIDGMENADAASNANITILTVPFAAHIDIIQSIRDSLKDGDIFVDVAIPLETAINGQPTRTIQVWEGSAAAHAARLIKKDVKIVAAFNNLSSEALQQLVRDVDCDVLVCSDHADARQRIMDLANKIPGARALDAGPLENARIVEQITALLISLNIRYKKKSSGIRITGI